jgi:exodeoxyribonuclease V gamma subunit
MLHIHTSNHLERLIKAFASVIQQQPLPPLIPETIVVQSKGMERWLSMQLAQHIGVWAQGYFPFPNDLLWRVFKETLPDNLPDTSRFEREVMVWSLMDILPDFLNYPEFTELHSYLYKDDSDIKRFQLAWRIADIFDQYLVYRPTWLADWENGKQPFELQNDLQAHWQALLWQKLVERHGASHRANLRARFFQHLSNITNSLRFSQRLSVFGISALPPFHLEVLAELGKVIDVQVFLLNPCQEYWGHIVSDSDMALRTARVKGEPVAPESLYFEKGNSLLASMGKMARDFIDMLNDYPHDSHDYFERPDAFSEQENLSELTLLQTIQSDILSLTDRNDAMLIDEDDHSVQIHACHSPMREVEVLHDQLLALFEQHPELLPKEVLVMMPDIEKYAPFIEAVFDTTPEEAKRIPFSIADRSLRGESALIDAFFAILELGKSRFSVSHVLAVLETEVVQKRFGLNEQDLDLIRHWIEQTRIRWGMDKADRARMNLPAFDENTWQAGLKRLLLGYALPGGGEQLFEEILPYDDIEGSDTLILGKLAAFVESLFDSVQALTEPRTLPEWHEFLNQLIEMFLESETEMSQTQAIRKVLSDLLKQSQHAGFEDLVSYDVILECLRYPLTQEEQSSHFMTGKVSFCAMLPMRSIPFKVIALLGMDDQAYPRTTKPLGFDLIAKNPLRGDRSRRQNDRYLFLESLLSARQCFYISYVGQSIHDNSIMPPSVLVSELLDYINNGFSCLKKSILEQVVTSHPLQAFSPTYFTHQAQQLFSYSTEYCTASRALLNEQPLLKPFILEALPSPQPETEWKNIDLNRLSRFFKQPIEFLLKERLGIVLQTGADLLDESEPFEVQGLDRYQLNQTLVEKSLQGGDLEAYQTVVKASGQLPYGQIGEYLYSQMTQQIQPFVEQVKQVTMKQKKMETVSVDLRIGEMRITGRLGRIWRDHLVHYRWAKLKAKDFIQLWIHHLILNSLPDKHLPRHSVLIGNNEAWTFEPVTDSQLILERLLREFYWHGLHQPLYFFPESGLTFVKNLRQGKKENEALLKALNTWQGSDFGQGEVENEYYKLCFRSLESKTPLENEGFKSLAKQFFEPLLGHLQAME